MIDIWERASRVGAWVIVCGLLVALLGFWARQILAPKQATRAALERPCAE